MKSLAERIEALIDSASSLWAAEELTEILADVREIESAAKFAHVAISGEMHDARDGNAKCDLCEAEGRLRAILSRTSGTTNETRES